MTVEITGDAVKTVALTPTVSTRIPLTDLVNGNERANSVLVTVETQVCRVSLTGVDATAITGHVLTVGTPYVFRGANLLRDIRFIDTAAGASTVRVTTLSD